MAGRRGFGEIELLVPRKRSETAYFPSFLEARRPAEQAIFAVVMEAYVNGVDRNQNDCRRSPNVQRSPNRKSRCSISAKPPQVASRHAKAPVHTLHHDAVPAQKW